jgi:universal stress protein A
MRANVHRILVPTDISAPSARAVDYAAGLGANLGASVHLIHVLDGLIAAEQPWAAEAPRSVEDHERRYQQSRRRLAAVAARMRDHVNATFEVRSGNVTAEIAKAAIDYGADLVVIATHGRSGLPHLLHGSVAEDVIRRGICPVLTLCDRETTDLALLGEEATVAVTAA